MKAGFDNQLMSSFLMWFDHTLLDKGQAFFNTSSQFPINQSYYPGLYCYNGPYKGLVYDTSISGATIMTGVNVDNNNYTLGAGNLTGINYFEGQVILGSKSNVVSGSYSVKEFNVVLTSQPEEVLLFETNYVRRNKTLDLQTGLNENSIPYPVIFLRNNGSKNAPFAFGGTDETRIEIKATVIADSQYMLDAVCSLFRDRNYDLVPLISESDNPFNIYGSFKNNTPFNYTTLTQNKDYAILDKISVSRIPSVKNKETALNPAIYLGVIDFELIKHRDPRRS